jgi:hypothetical protein
MRNSGRLHAKAFTRAVNNLLLLASACLVSFVAGHDFHFSRTDLRWNPTTRTVQTTVRVFTDDLEMALLKALPPGEEVRIWLGDELEWAQADSALKGWVDKHLEVRMSDVQADWRWVGKEVELDVSYLYVESQPWTDSVRVWSVRNTMLFDVFEDQVNEVHLHDTGSDGVQTERREMLNREWPSVAWDGSEPSLPSDD